MADGMASPVPKQVFTTSYQAAERPRSSEGAEGDDRQR